MEPYFRISFFLCVFRFADNPWKYFGGVYIFRVNIPTLVKDMNVSDESSKAIQVPANELIPGHTYYIHFQSPLSKEPIDLPIPDCSTTNRFDDYIQLPIVGIFAFKTGPTEYMFTHVSFTSISPSYPHFFNSRFVSFYTSVRYAMMSVYRGIRMQKGDISFREDLISYVWEPSRVQRFWMSDGIESYESMI